MAENSPKTTGDTSYLRSPSFWILGFIGFSIGGVLSFKVLRQANPAMTLFDGIEEMLFFGFLLSMMLWMIRAMVVTSRSVDKISDQKIEALEKRAEEAPEKVRYAWDLARVKLEAYFDRNLNQVRMIFYVAVIVMLAGFGFILWGLHAAVTNPEHVRVALIASVSGVITQFIGLTFMLIYKSTMLQAAQFMGVLERINTVGMAVGILDAMKDDNGDLKDTTRVDIIRLLLATPSSQMSFTPRSSKRSPKNDGPNKRDAATV